MDESRFVRSRAATDLQCTHSAIAVERIARWTGPDTYRATGCDQFATYVCVYRTGCFQSGPHGSTRPPPVGAERVFHDGVAFDLPPGFLREKQVEIFHDLDDHHVVTLASVKTDASESEWLAAHHSNARSWTAKVGDREMTFATRTVEGRRLSFAVIARAGSIYELSCSSDQATEKTDRVCSTILESFRWRDAGLPGE